MFPRNVGVFLQLHIHRDRPVFLNSWLHRIIVQGSRILNSALSCSIPTTVISQLITSYIWSLEFPLWVKGLKVFTSSLSCSHGPQEESSSSRINWTSVTRSSTAKYSTSGLSEKTNKQTKIASRTYDHHLEWTKHTSSEKFASFC